MLLEPGEVPGVNYRPACPASGGQGMPGAALGVAKEGASGSGRAKGLFMSKEVTTGGDSQGQQLWSLLVAGGDTATSTGFFGGTC